MRLNFVVCNICKDPTRDVTTYTIGRSGEAVEDVDLCREHAAPLEELLASLADTEAAGEPVKVVSPIKRAPAPVVTPAERRPKASAKRTGSRNRPTVMTMEEVAKAPKAR